MNPLLHGLPALPQAMGVGFDPSSQEEVLGKISKLRGTHVQIMVALDTFVGLNGQKLVDKLTQKIYSKMLL